MIDAMPHHNDAFLPDLCRVNVALSVILVTELVVIVYVLSLGSLAAFNWESLSLLSLYAQWIALLSVVGLCQMRGFLNRQPPRRAAMLAYGWVMAAALFTNTGAQWIYSGRNFVGWSGAWLLRDLCIAAVLAGIALRYLFMHQRWQNEQRAKSAAQIDALNARIRPHFLFNSMNTIASLIGYAPEAAERAVEDLSALFRASLSHSDELVEWQREKAVCEAYLRIEQQRLGERLQVEWLDTAVPDNFRLPPLSLQPLVENAIYHGIEMIPGGGELRVHTAVSADMLEISVSNPLPASTGNNPRRTHGMALNNIRERLSAIYGDRENGSASLSLREEDHQYYARLLLPLV